jgi:hypothetical protein
MTTEAESELTEPPRDIEAKTVEQTLRDRVHMLTQFLVLAGVTVVIQFGIMIKVLLESAR